LGSTSIGANDESGALAVLLARSTSMGMRTSSATNGEIRLKSPLAWRASITTFSRGYHPTRGTA
jgi:hypothetical protein